MIRRFSVQEGDEIAELLRGGGVLVFPTETSYGIGCDATNDSAVANVFAAKGREDGKGTPMLVASLQHAHKYVEFSSTAEALARRYWPGALNIVLPAKEGMHGVQCQTDGTQSVRVSSHPFIQDLFKRFDRPLVATSANPSGSEALYDVLNIEEIFGDRSRFINGVVDAGSLPVVPASTTVRVVGNDVEVLRQGSIRV